MSGWLLISNDRKITNSNAYSKAFNLGKYKLHVSESKNLTVTENNGILLMIQGYIQPRLNYKIGKTIHQDIIEGLRNDGPQHINNFKGNFIIITWIDNKLLIFNDQFGIFKYFYSQMGNSFIASDKLSVIGTNIKLSLSEKNLIKYLIFNYFIEGTTIYNECKYSTGANYHLLSQSISKGEYFSIEEFIDNRQIIHSNKDSIRCASEIWKILIKNYLDFFKSSKISQTLTAGLDSRLILAGFRSNNHQPSTFTFGDENSLDVVHAKKVAKKLGLKHDHMYPDELFFQNFKENAKEVIIRSSGMSTLFRGHRLNAYKRMSHSYDILLFGFIGSEVIRGLSPDGLTVPKIVSDLWVSRDLNIEEYFDNDWFNFSNEDINSVKDDIYRLKHLQRPDLFIFKVMVPLHFGQDINLNNSIGINSIAPYWDIDFIDFLKSTPFFTNNERKEKYAKSGHFSRRKGPLFSSKLIKSIDKENSKFSLGKGYSPSDFAFSMHYAAAKFALYRVLFRKRYHIPNFKYDEWFKKYLIEYIETNSISFLDIDKNTLASYIKSIQGNGESAFINIVKVINIDLIMKEL